MILYNFKWEEIILFDRKSGFKVRLAYKNYPLRMTVGSNQDI